MSVTVSGNNLRELQSDAAYSFFAEFLRKRTIRINAGIACGNFIAIQLGESRDAEGRTYGAAIIFIPAGDKIEVHKHALGDAIVHILEGDGLITLSTHRLRYRPGQAYHILREMWHGFEAIQDTYFYSTQSGAAFVTSEGLVDVTYQNESCKTDHTSTNS